MSMYPKVSWSAFLNRASGTACGARCSRLLSVSERTPVGIVRLYDI